MTITKRVLIVDRDRLFGRFLLRLVQMLTHYDTVMVESHEEAMKLLKDTQVDIVLTDIETGKSEEYISQAPKHMDVIAMSGHHDDVKERLPKGARFMLKADIMRNQLVFIDKLQ